MKFDTNNYPGNYLMHCKTEEEAIDIVSKAVYPLYKKWKESKDGINGSALEHELNYITM